MRSGSAASLAIAHTRLADGNRTDAGHNLALWQMAVADDALMAVRGLQIGMLADKVRDLGLNGLGQQDTRRSGWPKPRPPPS